MGSWAEKAVFYHIYPLGFCGAPFENSLQAKGEEGIEKVTDWIEHFINLGINAIYFGPVFEAKSHGYDTTDYMKIDKRLGTNEDFAKVCKALHKAGIKVVVDGIFSHVGRDFFAFKDLQKNGSASKFKDWFQNVNFNGRSPMGDNFYYDAWEGHFELAKLNLRNEEVRNYLFKAVEGWIDEFDIDGIRLDVAYCLDEDFLRALRSVVDHKKSDFWLMGEMIHGDYRRLIKPGLLDSATNYECYKGIYSSHNDKNYFEINHSLNRLFGKGGLYEGLSLYSFVDNHDVTRIATILKEKKHIDNVYTLLFTMPGIPSVYYGSEWHIQGSKERTSDQSLRPCLELNEMLKRDQQLVHHIHRLAAIRNHCEPLTEGGYEQVIVRNEQLLFARIYKNEKVYVALNLADHSETLKMKGSEEEHLTNILDEVKKMTFENGEYQLVLKPFSAMIIVPRKMVKEEMLINSEQKDNIKETSKATDILTAKDEDEKDQIEDKDSLDKKEEGNKKEGFKVKIMKLFAKEEDED